MNNHDGSHAEAVWVYLPSSKTNGYTTVSLIRQTLIIRRATQEDAGIIADLGARTFEASFGPQNRPEDMQAYLAVNFSMGRIKTEINDPASMFLLALEEDEAIGYAMLRASRSPDAVTGPSPVELVRIYVEQEVIGKGYGSALMEACLRTAEGNGYRTIWLGVWERNERAIGFYERWEFTKVGVKVFILGSDIQWDFIMARPVKLN